MTGCLKVPYEAVRRVVWSTGYRQPAVSVEPSGRIRFQLVQFWW